MGAIGSKVTVLAGAQMGSLGVVTATEGDPTGDWFLYTVHDADRRPLGLYRADQLSWPTPVLAAYKASETGALKHEGGKLHLELVPVSWVEALAQVLQYGAYEKTPLPYGAGNWLKGGPWMDLVAAAFRHVYGWARGEDTDKESGQHHLVHAAVNVLMVFSQQALTRGTDDRALYNPLTQVRGQT